MRELQPGTILVNRYRIARLLSLGGCSIVYRAWDLKSNQAVALKQNLDNSPQVVAQFQREAEILVKLKHPNLPRVFDWFQDQGSSFLVMEYIEGENLHDLLVKSGIQPFTTVMSWLEVICDALSYLHSRQPAVIHGDIMPRNLILMPPDSRLVILTDASRLVLVDFGISKTADPLLRTATSGRAVSPPYSPLEQYGSAGIDQRSDQYALAVTTFVLLTGVEPPEALERLMGTPMPETGLAPEVEKVLFKAMFLMKDGRYADIQDYYHAMLAALPIRLNARQIVRPPVPPVHPRPAPPVTPVQQANSSKSPFVIPDARLAFLNAPAYPQPDLFSGHPIGGTLTVGGPGGYRSIGVALRAAPDHARILIKPGTYHESLKVERPVQLVADGPVGSVTITAEEEDVLYVHGESVSVKGLKFIYTAGNTRDRHQRGALHIAQGTSVFVACEFITDWQIGVNLHNANTCVVFEDCEFSGGLYAAVSVTRSAKARLTRCRFTGSEIGIEAIYKKNEKSARKGGQTDDAKVDKNRTRVWLEQVLFSDCPQGISISDQAEGFASNLSLKGQAVTLVQVRSGARLMLYDTHLQRLTRAQGVVGFGNAKVGLVNCSFQDFQKATALAFGGKSQVILQSCVLTGNQPYDLHLFSGAACWDVGSNLKTNPLTRVKVEPGANLYD